MRKINSSRRSRRVSRSISSATPGLPPERAARAPASSGAIALFLQNCGEIGGAQEKKRRRRSNASVRWAARGAVGRPRGAARLSPGGSSSVFSSAFCDSECIRSAGSITNTRRFPERGASPARCARPSGSVRSLITLDNSPAAPFFLSVGVGRSRRPGGCPVRRARTHGSSPQPARARGPRTAAPPRTSGPPSALPTPSGPWNRRACGTLRDESRRSSNPTAVALADQAVEPTHRRPSSAIAFQTRCSTSSGFAVSVDDPEPLGFAARQFQVAAPHALVKRDLFPLEPTLRARRRSRRPAGARGPGPISASMSSRIVLDGRRSRGGRR